MAEGDEIEASVEDPTLPLKDITDPQDTDVLCGRGGAALRHPGNQTYRRLVHLNKGLYITCLKAEKLKISRSIVAAIREQNGRFLERNTKNGTWFDIGDKKAMEKTSQALREGQPKLRQKIVELGGGAAGAAALLETQFPGSNMYQISQATSVAAERQQKQKQAAQAKHQQEQQQQQATAKAQQQQKAASMAAPPDTLSGDMMSRRMSLTETTIAEEPPNYPGQFPQSTTPTGSTNDLGIERSTFSLMSDISHFGITESNLSLESVGMRSFMSKDMPPPPAPIGTPGSLAGSLAGSIAGSMSSKGGMDRRKYFAKMKYARPASGRMSAGSSGKPTSSQRSIGTDGMPDIHLVESSPSLYSDVSTTSNVPDVVSNVSRRSLMSGLSRISDTSVGSIFSDLSKKIGNVSTRSIAMSEISHMDDQGDIDEEGDSESIDTDRMPATVTSMSHSMEEL